MSAVEAERLPRAVPCEDHVFCTDCGEPHRATFVDGAGFVEMDDTETPCEAYARRFEDWGTPVVGVELVDELPKDWDREHHAGYQRDFDTFDANGRRQPGRTRYLLVKKRAPLLDCHKAMYYLTEDADD